MQTQARLPNLGERIYGELDSIALDRLIGECEALLPEISTGPWKADVRENIGENWHLASFGQNREGAEWILTTDHVHASEYDGDAEADAKFCALSRNLMALLIAELRRRPSAGGERRRVSDDDVEYIADDDGIDLETCWACGGSGCFHDCGEDCCCCEDPDEITETCEECHGSGEL